jgi:predicted PurR-regulated permease PerM
MKPEDTGQQRLARAFFAAGLTFFAIVLLVYGANILIPLAVSLLVWFFLNALASMFQRIRFGAFAMPRLAALTLAVVATGVAGFLAVDVVISNLAEISATAGNVQESLNPWIDRIAEKAGVSNKQVLNTILDRIGLERLLGNIITAMASFASQLGVILIYVIFLLVEQQFFDLKLNALVRDEARQRRIREVLDRIASDIQNYMWIMTLVSGMTAGLSYLVMSWMGLGQPGFWAFLIFALNFIPTIGSILGTLLPAVYALVQFQALSPVITLLLLIGVIQFVLGNVVQPRMAGQSLNMSQLVVILSLFVWGAIWGITGMFLAVPLTSILMLVLSNFEATRPAAILLSREGRFDEDGGKA